jgi:hypothetical protein
MGSDIVSPQASKEEGREKSETNEAFGPVIRKVVWSIKGGHYK